MYEKGDKIIIHLPPKKERGHARRVLERRFTPILQCTRLKIQIFAARINIHEKSPVTDRSHTGGQLSTTSTERVLVPSDFTIPMKFRDY